MSSGLKTLGTLLVLAGVLLLAAYWGFSAVTEPFPGKSDAPVCVDRTVTEGEKVFTSDVTVSVDNAGDRNGLAGYTLNLFKDAGFAVGSTGNAPQAVAVPYAEIWTATPTSPAVALVKARLGARAKVVEHKESAPGVLVVVGDRFDHLLKGRPSVVAVTDATICSPPID